MKGQGALKRLACLGVGAVVFLFYLPVLQNRFVNWDEPYLLLNNHFLRGLSWPNIRWMLTSTYMTTYQPLGWLLYACLHSLQGLRPFGFHMASLLLHAANSGLLFWTALRLMDLSAPTRRQEGSRLVSCALACLLWALHPLQVQAAAWVTAMPDLLATSFFLAALLAYLKSPGSSPWLLASWSFFLLSSLSRWKGISLPLVLVILDFYPLRRLGGPRDWLSRGARRVWLEKVPFLLLAAGVALAMAHAKGLGTHFPISSPGEASARVLFYLGKLLIPSNLIAYYSPSSNPPWPLGLEAVLVLALSMALVLWRRKAPWALAAWASYLAGIGPTVAFTQQGPLLLSNHYAYLACLGLVPLLAAGLERLWAGPLRALALAAPPAALGFLAPASRSQMRVWRDSESLWTRTLSVDPASFVAHANLGAALLEKGRTGEAIERFKAQLRINPLDRVSRIYLERLLARRSLRETPAILHNDFGAGLYEQGQEEEALFHLSRAAELDPGMEEAQNNLGLLFYRRGEWKRAVGHFRLALKANPNFAEAHNNLGIALARQGSLEEAARHFSLALETDPNFLKAQENLGMARRLLGEGLSPSGNPQR